MLRIAVSRAKAGEASAIAEISSEAAQEDLVKELKPEEVRELVSNPGYYLAVGKVDDEVAGYALSAYSWGKLHIRDVAVRKTRKRIGVARALIQHLVSHALEAKLSEAYCEVKARNIAALNLFTSLGFRFRLFSTLIEEGFYGLYLPLGKCGERPLEARDYPARAVGGLADSDNLTTIEDEIREIEKRTEIRPH